VTSRVSALLRIPVRKDVAMTGEITLRGRVLPIGGLKEKVLAAHRSEIYKVIIPGENAKDLKDIPKRVLRVMEIAAVEHLDEVLRHALAVPDATKFLPGPSAVVDWRSAPAVAKAATPEVDEADEKPAMNH
jgi:ATP-dependent Lon protease